MAPAGDTPDDFLLEIKGSQDGDVTPENVDARALLELASQYIGFMQALAKSDDEDLDFTGIEVRRGSVCLAFRPSSQDLARDYANRAANYVESVEEPPAGMEGRTQTLGAAIRGLRPGLSTSVGVANWSRTVRVPATKAPELYWEMVTLRATPIRAGGVEPRVRFRLPGDEALFSLRAEPETARQLGGLLYRDVEITASVLLDEDGKVRAGRVDGVHVVSEDDPIAAWKSWLKQAAPHWTEVEDIEAELGRRDE